MKSNYVLSNMSKQTAHKIDQYKNLHGEKKSDYVSKSITKKI